MHRVALVGERAVLGALPLGGNFGCAVVSNAAPIKSSDASKEKIMFVRRGPAMKDEKPSFAVQLHFPDETLRLARAENRIAFHALAGAFIAGCLGKQAEPIGGDLQNSSVQILAGQELIPTLKAAMAPRESEAGAPP
jgi:hypothetical protein